LQNLPLRPKAKTNERVGLLSFNVYDVGGPCCTRRGNQQEGGLSLVSFQLLSTPADPGFWLRFRSGPVLT
jgi:hypothetical protein